MSMVKSTLCRDLAIMVSVLNLFGLDKCFGQSTMQVRFENQMSPGYYFESGMRFGNLYGGPEVLGLWTSGSSGYPDNGTQYLQMRAGSGLAFAFSSYAAFNLVSFDVAEYTTGFAGPRTLHVVG